MCRLLWQQSFRIGIGIGMYRKWKWLRFVFRLAALRFIIIALSHIIRPICRQIGCGFPHRRHWLHFVTFEKKPEQAGTQRDCLCLCCLGIGISLYLDVWFAQLFDCQSLSDSDSGWLLAIQVTCFLFLPIHAAAAAAVASCCCYCCCCCCCCVFVAARQKKETTTAKCSRLSSCKSRVLIVCRFFRQCDTTWDKLITRWQSALSVNQAPKSSFLLGQVEGQLSKWNWKNPVELTFLLTAACCCFSCCFCCFFVDLSRLWTFIFRSSLWLFCSQ